MQVQWIITAEGYLRFLAESRRVFSAIEEIVQTNDDCEEILQRDL